jgi:integrase
MRPYARGYIVFSGLDDGCFLMPKVAAEMSALEVRNLSHPTGNGNALFAVGGVTGLYMQITPSGGRSWILRTTVGKARRDIGLGGFPTVTLAMARDKAREARDKIERGLDPVAERQAAKAALIAASGRGLTFERAVESYLKAKLDAFKNAKHRQQWENTLSQYALPVLGKMMVQDIDVRDVLRVLQPLWHDKTETASRLRGRIESVLSWATVAGHRKGDNPARWAGNLKELLPAPSKVAKEGNQPALTLEEARRWFAALKKREGMGARALEFLALTAARSQEVRGATWDEIDLDNALWVVPAARMKMGREHRVPLTAEAVALLKTLPRMKDNPLVFPAARGGQLSDMTVSAVMRRMSDPTLAKAAVGSWTGFQNGQPCRMACGLPSATGWPNGRTSPAKWPRSLLPTRSATRWKRPTGVAT